MRRVSVDVPASRAEETRAQMIELFPEGFEEVDHADGIELVAYTDAGGEERLWHTFGGVRKTEIAGDWRDRWKEFHRPVRVGPLWIGPSWHEPPADAATIVIDPGRAFGTGAHPTTRLCVELLLELEPSSVVDLGCGSGILAIVAAKLGFANITRPALEALAPRLRCKRLVSSGYLPTDPRELPAFRLVRRNTRDGWAADLYEAM